MAIEESKDLTSLSLDELIENLKVYKMIIKKDSKIVKEKVKRKSVSLKAKKESSDEECSTSDSKDEEYAMARMSKTTKRQEPKIFVRGTWRDSSEEDDEKVKDETCLVAHASSEICLEVNLKPNEWIKDSGCSKHMMGNPKIFSTYKAYNRGYSQNSKAYIILNKHIKKVKESINVTFDETSPPSKTSPLVDDDLDEEEAIKVIKKKNLENDIVYETLDIDKIVNIKESRNHPLENVIGNFNQSTLRLQSQNKNFAHILRIPCEGACVFSDRWSLDELVYGAPSEGLYQTNLPSPDDIISFIREDREGQVTRIRHQEEVKLELQNESYVLYDRVINPLAAQLERKLERIVAREEVVIPLPPPPSMNHLHPISTMMMMEIMKGPHVQDLQKIRKIGKIPCLQKMPPITAGRPPNIYGTASQENTSSSFHSKLHISPPSSHERTAPHHLNHLLENISNVPPRPLNPQPLQSHPSLDITLSLSLITHLDHIHETTSPPQPQPPIMGHPLFYNYHDYHGSTCMCCSYNQNLFFTLREEMNIMFAHLEYLLTTAITSHFSPPP
nr:alpha/beta hydrolases superfamily protein [Tanacetum cinerariifolium]